MKIHFSAFLLGLLFALGLGFSGMTDPGRVRGFLSIFGEWDISLLLVMAGAVSVYMLGFWFIRKKDKPLFSHRFDYPIFTALDSKLIVGSLTFGVGWGLSGFCPGPAIVNIITFRFDVLLFVGSMILSIVVYEWIYLKMIVKDSSQIISAGCETVIENSETVSVE